MLDVFNFITPSFIVSAIVIAIAAFTYADILTDYQMILSGFKAFLRKHIKANWMYKILIDCARCIAGQAALWTYLYCCLEGHSYLFSEHLIFIIMSIFFTDLIQRLWIKFFVS